MSDIDWNEALVNAAISAMQGVQEGKFGVVENFTPELLAKQSVVIAKALIKELQKEIDGSNIVNE